MASFLAHFRVRQKNCNKLYQEEGFPAFSSLPTASSSIRPLHTLPPLPHPLDAILNGNRLARVNKPDENLPKFMLFKMFSIIILIYLTYVLQEQSIIQRINLSWKPFI